MGLSQWIKEQQQGCKTIYRGPNIYLGKDNDRELINTVHFADVGILT